MRSLIFSLSFAGVVLAVAPAHAALTDSEKAQIVGFVRSAEIGNARRVRALVARPDLSADEAAEPLVNGFSGVRFDDKRAAFAKELLVGSGSAAARSDMTPAVVKALLARS